MVRRFKNLVDRHRDRIYTFAFYNLGNKEEAEDVTQEVLIKFWKNCEGVRDDTLQAWLSRVTKNACIDAVRRRRAYTSRIVATPDGEPVFHAASNQPTPDRTAENAELREQIGRALSRIDEPYRSIVIFREIQDMKYDQISAALDLPLNTVKSYLHRGRKMLRDHLREAYRREAF